MRMRRWHQFGNFCYAFSKSIPYKKNKTDQRLKRSSKYRNNSPTLIDSDTCRVDFAEKLTAQVQI